MGIRKKVTTDIVSEPDTDKLRELQATDGKGSEDSGSSGGHDSSGTSNANSTTVPEGITGGASTSSGSTKRRGRPPGSKNRPRNGGEVDKSPILPPAVVKAVIRMPYDVAASQYGEHWRLSDEEIDIMVPAHLELANQYLPEWLKEHAALYTCLAFHGMYLSVRFAVQMQIRKEEAKKDEKPTPLEPESRPNGASDNVTGEKRFGQVYEAKSNTE